MNIINIAKFDSSKFPFHLAKKDDDFVEALLSTEIALAQYNQLLVQMKRDLPSNLLNLFITPLEQKEAQKTSKIEGTVTNLEELYDYNITNKDDDEGTNNEVNQYTEAIKYAHKQMEGGRELDQKLLKETHKILLSSTRGKSKSPGKYRTQQNYIKNSVLGEFWPCDQKSLSYAIEQLFAYINQILNTSLEREEAEPRLNNPEQEYDRLRINAILANDLTEKERLQKSEYETQLEIEQEIKNRTPEEKAIVAGLAGAPIFGDEGVAEAEAAEEETVTEKNALINIAMIHAQFESIHPFEDGNGRIGRMIITLLMWRYKKIAMPNFYISSYLEGQEARDQYYSALRNVDKDKDWKNWYMFFFKAVKSSSEKNLKLAQDLRDLHKKTDADLSKFIDKNDKKEITLNFLFENPNFPASKYYKGKVGPVGRKYLKSLEEKKIIREISPAKGRAPAKYVFEAFFKLMDTD